MAAESSPEELLWKRQKFLCWEGGDCAAVGNWKQHGGGIPPRGIAVEKTEIPLLGRGGLRGCAELE